MINFKQIKLESIELNKVNKNKNYTENFSYFK